MTAPTETDFINHEVAVWGSEYIESLIDRGYTPTLFSDGKWRWVWPSAVPATNSVQPVRVGS